MSGGTRNELEKILHCCQLAQIFIVDKLMRAGVNAVFAYALVDRTALANKTWNEAVCDGVGLFASNPARILLVEIFPRILANGLDPHLCTM